MGAALEIRGLSIRFGGIAALSDLDLDLPGQTAMGLVGPNGSGKSSLVNVLSGHYPPASGQVSFAGERIDGLPPSDLARRGIGRTFQSPRVYRRLTVFENMRAAKHAGSPWSETLWQTRASRRREREEILNALVLFGLADHAHAMPDALTLVELRFLELARSLIAGPKLLLLDEPAAGMTAQETEILGQALEEHVLPGRSVLLIEHKLELVSRLCDEIAVLQAGRRLAVGPTETVLRASEPRAVLLGEGADA